MIVCLSTCLFMYLCFLFTRRLEILNECSVYNINTNKSLVSYYLNMNRTIELFQFDFTLVLFLESITRER